MSALLALAINLAGVLFIYSMLAFALARFSWHRRGMAAVIFSIFMAGVFWIVPAFLAFRSGNVLWPASLALWFGNWLVGGFSVVILCHAVRWIPRELEDSARMDGCGFFGIWWHVFLPFVRRELVLIAFLTVLATAVPLCAVLLMPIRGELFPPWFTSLSLSIRICLMIAGWLVAMLPVVAILFFAKNDWQRAPTSSAPLRSEYRA